MLTSTGFCDQLLLTHVFGKQRESDAMIEPMSAGVVEILAFDEDLRSTHLRGHVAQWLHGDRAILQMFTHMV